MELDRQATSYAELCQNFRWQIPERFNLAVDVCGRWADERSRFALYYEDADGFTSAHTFWDIQREANRLANVLAALGTLPRDRVAIVLPQRPEAAITLVAICQMGALAVPLSPFLDADALAWRLADSGTHVAIVDGIAAPRLRAIRQRLPQLRHVLGVGCAAGEDIRLWVEVLEHASPRYTPVVTAAGDPAMILYGGSRDPAAGEAGGVLLAQRTLLGSLGGFVCAHDFYPQPQDLFWSPTDWASPAGLFGGLLPTWHFGMPLLAYNGSFEAGKSFALIEKYGVRNCFFTPSDLQLLRMAMPEPRLAHDLDLRSLVSGGEPIDDALACWARDKLGVPINRIFGQTELHYVLGNCSARWPAKPGAMGRAYPGHRVAVVDRQGRLLPQGETGEIAVHRQYNGDDDPAIMLEYWNDPAATVSRFVGDGWCLTGELAMMDADGDLWYPGWQRRGKETG